jgi:hypothetical protein
MFTAEYGSLSYHIQKRKTYGNQLPADVLGSLSCKPCNFRKRIREVINKAKLRGDQRSKVK